MGENQLLVDTDVLIAYLNRRAYRSYLEASKRGLRTSERRAILALLRRFRMLRIDQRIAKEYARVRSAHPSLERGDALIAATALAKKLPLLTQNLRHFRVVKELILLPLPR